MLVWLFFAPIHQTVEFLRGKSQESSKDDSTCNGYTIGYQQCIQASLKLFFFLFSAQVNACCSSIAVWKIMKIWLREKQLKKIACYQRSIERDNSGGFINRSI